jgi:hypothetical protein
LTLLAPQLQVVGVEALISAGFLLGIVEAFLIEE